MTSSGHPFDPVRPEEIALAAEIARQAVPGVDLRFKAIDILEPPKQDMIPYLEAERLENPLPQPPPRVAYMLFHRLDSNAFLKSLINLTAKAVLSLKELPSHVQGPVDVDEMIDIEQLCLNHPDVKKEIEKLQLPEGMAVCNDPWIYGTDSDEEDRRLFQCYMYIVPTNHPQSNHYSLPCPFSPVFDGNTKELVRIDHLALGGDHMTHATTQPWKPVKAIEYAHDLLDHAARTDLKPYTVQQPQGPSFNLDGNQVEWQKWKFRVGFNYREGLVLHNVTFDKRNVFYRLSLSEMTVPYGDPRRPYHRKQAFDIGDVGLGVTCNQLSLGCDCLGHIKYYDGFRTDSKGQPIHLKNVVCLHEQDAGILHKHTNYRTGEATVVRNRQLVVQMICTVSNYEYIFAWILDLAGGIEFEVRATGILSTTPVEGNPNLPWSTIVGPGVSAPNHQHIFSLRIDPAIDGHENTVVYEDSVPLTLEDGHDDPFGCGYIAKTTVLDKATAADLNVSANRVFKIRNDNIINRISGKPVAYKVETAATQGIIMGPSSFNYKRAKFTARPVWVTRYRDGELFAAGEFTNQSRTSTGVENWVARNDPIRNQDVVFWHTFGLTHNPRPEDFPVMPVERISVNLKPSGFHEKNPALDVPQSAQNINQASLHSEPNKRECCAKI